jgi:hypothetical protein
LVWLCAFEFATPESVIAEPFLSEKCATLCGPGYTFAPKTFPAELVEADWIALRHQVRLTPEGSALKDSSYTKSRPLEAGLCVIV